ncbi:MAG: ATP-dependent helicase, partial [Chloroflexota bacterium]|nr:ATP-dependent helicase [Chloroflexota bacterium]
MSADLNPEQLAASTWVGGPLRIVAGAGTGKTSTLTHRFVYLVREHHIPADQILAVTFSSKAAAEMRSRIVEQLGGNTRRLWIQTFHACCLRLLGEWARAEGRPDPRVLSDLERLRIVRQAIADLPVAERRYYHGDHGAKVMARDLITFADRLQDDLIAPELLEEFARSARGGARLADLRRGLDIYQRLMIDSGAHDFGSLTAATISRLETDDGLREETRARFRHMLVDEFQDTNHAQFRLIQLLAPAGDNICVVGDSNQAIYAFRGGRAEYFDRFTEHFPRSKTFKLTGNYRSGQTILTAANNLVRHNDASAQLELFAQRTEQATVTVNAAESPELEAETVARRILAIISDPEKSIQFRDIAVLFRSVRGSAEPFQRMFSAFGIPFSLGPIVGLDYAIRSDIRAALRLIIGGPGWEDAARLSLGRGGSANARQRLERRLSPEDLEVIVRNPAHAPEDLDPDEIVFLAIVRSVVDDALAVPLDSPLSMVLYRAIHLSGHLNEGVDPAQAQQLAQLVRAATAIEGPDATLADLLDLVAGNMRDYDDQPPEDKFGVQMLTVHAAKGLEWPVVFVVGLAEGVFPLVARTDRDADVLSLVRALSSDAERAASAAEVEQLHVQEERRLAYVAVTRACRELHLTFSRSYGDERVEPSRFLSELGLEPTSMPIDDEYERLASVHALGRQLRYRQKMALRADPAGEAGSAALVDLLVAQWAARHVSGVVPLRDRRLPVPYGEGESISFSASDLSTYDSCPRQYLYAALLKLQREETGAALLLGNLVHKVLETVNRHWQETGIILDDATVESLVDQYWPRVGFDVGVQSRQLQLRAKAMIRRYLSWERSQPAGRKPIWIEQY